MLNIEQGGSGVGPKQGVDHLVPVWVLGSEDEGAVGTVGAGMEAEPVGVERLIQDGAVGSLGKCVHEGCRYASWSAPAVDTL